MIHEVRQQQGPSSPAGPQFRVPGQPPYMDLYPQYDATQIPHTSTSSPPYQAPTYHSGNSPFAPGSQNPYPQPPIGYPGQNQPPVTTAEMHHSGYTYTTNPSYGYDPGRNNAPRYTGSSYETEPDYSPVTSGMVYPPNTAPDPRIPMDPRYTPESMQYQDRNNRPQPTRGDRRR
ncbi:transcription factor RfeG [Aspergillus sp. HF37]|nr:transcription factor RfeG [Aspergillus sp. HF37]